MKTEKIILYVVLGFVAYYVFKKLSATTPTTIVQSSQGDSYSDVLSGLGDAADLSEIFD